MQHYRPRTNQRFILNSATFQVSQMANGAPASYNSGEFFGYMQHRIVLHRGFFTDHDVVVVRPEHSPRPDSCPSSHFDAANQDGFGHDPSVGVNVGLMVT